jgi:Telomeric single stranded DNA binding POT1/CDC13
VKGKRLPSGSFFDASLDPFADDDGFVVGKGRKRTKFARHSDSWQLLDRTPSPEKETVDLRLDEAEGGRETAALPSQPQSSNSPVEPFDELPVEGAAFESRPGTTSAAPNDTHSLSNLPESQHFEVHPEAPDAGTGHHSQSDEAGQMQPPATRPQRTPPVPDMEMEVEAIARNEIQSPARSDQETPRLLPLQSPGLPLVSPLTTPAGLLSGYFPDMLDGQWEVGASGDEQGALTASETRFTSIDASNDKPVPSTDAEKVTLLSPGEVEKPHSPEPEVPGRNDLFELSSPTQELPPQPGQSLQAVSRSSFYEEIQPGRVTIQEQQQAPANVDGSDFEFLNISPLEGKSNRQEIWHLPETSASSLATIEARNDDGQLASTEASMSVADLPVDTTHEMLQNDTQTQPLSDELSKPETITSHLGEPAHTGNINVVLEKPPDSSTMVPIDPSLLNSLEVATELVVDSNRGVQSTNDPPGQISDSRPWTDKLNVSAVDAESQAIYNAPPFPFVQHWHNRPSSQRSRRSSQYSSFDGVSDEASADEPSGVEDMSDGSHELKTLDRDKRRDEDGETSEHILAPTPELSSPVDDDIRNRNIYTPSKDLVLRNADIPTERGSVVVLDSSDEDATYDARSESSVKDATGSSVVRRPEEMVDLKAGQVSDIGSETQISMDDIHELQTDRIEGPTSPLDTARDEPSSPGIHITVPTQTEPQTEISPTQRQDVTGHTLRPPTELTISVQQPSEVPAQRLQYQLVTPESTQQERGDQQLQDHSAELGRETSLPPSPQNTQEYADVPQPTAEPPITADAEIKVAQAPKMPPSTGIEVVRERRRSPRLSRKFPPSQDVAEVVSPYFTPRRTSQMRARDQLTTSHKPILAGPSQGLTNDTIQVIEETKPNEIAVAREKLTLESPIEDQQNVGVATSISYYTPLSVLQDHFSQSVDVLAISTTESAELQRATSGPKDWYTTLHITESSLLGNKTITAQIFRPYKTALPKVQRGNIVLLRNFKVQSQKRKCILLSTESSAWAVFFVRREKESEVSEIDVEVVGPPVEYGPEENSHIIELEKWWKAEGEDRHPIQKQADHAIKLGPAAKKDDGGEVAHKLRDGTVYQDKEHISVPPPYHELRDGTLYRDEPKPEPKTEPPDRDATGNQKSDNAVVHVLRDGTLYQDETPSRPRRDGQRRSTVTPGEKPSKNETTKTTEGDVSEPADQTTNMVDEEAEADSGEESPTDEAVSLQIYHELRSGQRYADPTPTQTHTGQLDQQSGQGEGDGSVVHELRDGITYTDD